MHILVTNDDGVTAPGLLALVRAMKPLGKVSVLAPDRNWSASGHVKTLHRPLRARPVNLADGTPALASDGAPSDCVALALMGLISEPIDLVVSGINPFANLSHDLTYSGTVTAAMEAAINGVKALAFSLDSSDDTPQPLDYEPAAHVAQGVAIKVLENGLPANVLLNVNIPAVPANQIRGELVTRQGTRIYRDQLVRREDPRGRPYYWIGGDAPTGIPEPGTDIGALEAGYVSITPIQLDLTAYHFMDDLKKWGWKP
jgi:5'-nucleotidase